MVDGNREWEGQKKKESKEWEKKRRKGLGGAEFTCTFREMDRVGFYSVGFCPHPLLASGLQKIMPKRIVPKKKKYCLPGGGRSERRLLKQDCFGTSLLRSN